MWWILIIFSVFSEVCCLCGSNIRWSHNVSMEDVYGMWYGAGYAQHSVDMSDRPDKINCVTVYITDATVAENEWLDWNFPRYDAEWMAHGNVPGRQGGLSSSWLNLHRRRAKRSYEERRVKVMWDENGQTLERVYLYSMEEPGLWTAEKLRRPMEQAMKQRGVDLWYPEDLPYHPDVIRVLNVTPSTLIINRCSEVGTNGVISLILRRSPEKIDKSQWYSFLRQFYDFELPYVQRYATVCASCIDKSFVTLVIVSVLAVLTIR